VLEALERYGREISAGKKGADRERRRIRLLSRQPFAALPLAALRGTDLAKWRDEQQGSRSSATVRLDLALLSHMYTIARKEWGMGYLDNPVRAIRLPKPSRERDRRLEFGEEERLLAAASAIHPELAPIITLAIETGMRRGEICGAMRAWIRGQVLTLPDSKNGKARGVPLSSRAMAAMASLPSRLDGRITGMLPDYISKGFLAACRASGIEKMRFHDLRREATSRLFERGLSVMEVSAITGLSLVMLRRYTNLQAEDLARRLG
jgi:integrase